jgi:hypothetical protein
MKTIKSNYIGSFLFLATGVATAAANQPSFVGDWHAGCHKHSAGVYAVDTYQFNRDQTFRREQKKFTDKDCAYDAEDEVRVYEGTYKVVGPAGDLGPNTQKVDLTINKVFYTALGKAAQKRFIEGRYCSITDWKRGEQRDITGLACSGETIPAGTMIYDVVQVSGDHLYFGNQSFFYDITKRKNRPAGLDKSLAFNKQTETAPSAR